MADAGEAVRGEVGRRERAEQEVRRVRGHQVGDLAQHPGQVVLAARRPQQHDHVREGAAVAGVRTGPALGEPPRPGLRLRGDRRPSRRARARTGAAACRRRERPAPTRRSAARRGRRRRSREGRHPSRHGARGGPARGRAVWTGRRWVRPVRWLAPSPPHTSSPALSPRVAPGRCSRSTRDARDRSPGETHAVTRMGTCRRARRRHARPHDPHRHAPPRRTGNPVRRPSSRTAAPGSSRRTRSPTTGPTSCPTRTTWRALPARRSAPGATGSGSVSRRSRPSSTGPPTTTARRSPT